MANIINDDDDDRLIDAEDSSSDDEQEQQQEAENQEQTLSLPSVAGSGKRKLKKSEIKRNRLVTIQPGLIRLSGLPYGFFERELYSYFSQFGDVTRLKLIRSKKTGGSRGYAYVEFEDEDVARIASESMNGYLMFRSLIKSRVMDRSKIDTDKLFQNWKKIFSVKTPKQKRALYNRVKSDEQITKSNQRRAKKLLKQQDKLNSIGIKYELTDFIPLEALKKGDEEKKSLSSKKKNEEVKSQVSKKENIKSSDKIIKKKSVKK
ncbi:unnamed protein product [Adineta steineri]|uniref:RRM domain-containing protein n=2 Tax=Adineta steineri TaxID=433720 RepID=A0A813YFU7_9BILA|nr:unnamed protein product [Adineta steineri]